MRPFVTVRGPALSALAFAFLLTASIASAQAPGLSPPASAAQVQKAAGQIHIKLTPTAQQAVALRTANGATLTSVPALDALNARFDVASMKRLFRPAGKHEARHVAWGLDRWYVVELGGPRDADVAVAAYGQSPAVELAERTHAKQLHGERVELTEAMLRTLDGPPDDPLYPLQWHYDNDGTISDFAIEDADIDAPEAWAIETGHPDVVVQIVDSGMDLDHPDLVAALWVNAGEDANGNGVFDPTPAAEGGDLNGIDDDGNGFVDDVVGYSHADDSPVPEADGAGSHGVHVGGTVAARSNDGFGAAGVAGGDGTPDSGVRLMISQTFGATNVAGFAEAIVYGADNGAVIANHSWGYTNPGTFEQAVLDAIDYFVANAGGEGSPIDGGLFVSSAGNSGADGEFYPGFYEPALAVSSLGVAFQRSLFNSSGSSNFGTWVDVAGPGGDYVTNNNIQELVLSTVVAGQGYPPVGGNHDYYQGTSMSSPHVAGVAALVASYEYRQGTQLTAAELRARVASPNTTKEIDGYNPGYEGLLGVGMASAELAILNPPGDGTAPDAVDDLTVDDVVGNAVVLSFTVPEDSEAPAPDDPVVERVTGIDLRYSADPITEETFDDAFAAPLDLDGPPEAGDEITTTIENLSYNETYYFAVKTTDRFGNTSALSNVPTATTGDAPFSVDPTEFIVTLESGDQTSDELTITNESARNIEFDIEIVGSASAEVEFLPPGFAGEKLEQWKLANQRAWAGEYPRGDLAGADPALAAPSRDRSGDREVSGPTVGTYAAPTLIQASSFDLFENQYGTFDLGTPEDWDVLGSAPTDYWAADYARGVDDRLYAFRCGSGFFSPCGDNAFGTLDPTTGEFTVIKATWDNPGYPRDMTGDLTDGTLYAYTSLDEIYRVDRFTGATELVTTVNTSNVIIAVTTDDQGVMYGHDITSDQIVTIDLETGDVTEVGPTGFDASFIQGMDFDPTTGRLYLAAYNVGVPSGERAELRVASRETGNSVLVGKINGDGAGEFSFLAVPGEGFVTTNLVGATLRAGRSVDVDVTFDANLLLAGEYTAAIRVAANGLPGSPAVDVPISLTVTGDPIAVVDEDSLDFGEVFLNGTETRSFTVSNDGVDDLTVTGIAIDDDAYTVVADSVAGTSFTLEPGESRLVTVEFTPTELGEHPATLTVSTDDPENGEITVALTGTGIPAPEIAVDPTSFDLQAFSGQTYTRTFTISNTGGNPLEYVINEQAISTTAVEPVLFFSEDFEDGFPDDWVVASTGTDPTVSWALASELGRPTDPNYASSGDAAMADSDGPQGPGAPGYDTEMWTPELTLDRDDYTLDFVLSFNSIDSGDFVDVDITLDGGATWTTMIQFANDVCSGSCFATPNGVAQSIPLDAFVSAGESFRVRWRYYTTDGTGWDWWAVVDDVAITRNVEWLSVAPPAGTIAPGESEEITLTIDADLPAGEYGATLVVTSNDPTSNGEFVDINLTVIESIAVSPTPGDDDLEVNPNETFLVPITVASLQDLGVESYQFTLFFDEDILEPVGIVTEGTLSEGTTTSVNTSVPGEIAVAVAEGASLESAEPVVLFTIEPMDIEGDNPVLVYVELKAKEVLGSTELSFGDTFQFNEGEPPVTGEVGSVTVVPLYGDVSLNLEVSAFDASLVLDAVVDAVDLNDAAAEAADVSGNGDVSALDASLILRYAAGDISCFPAEGGCSVPTGAVAALRQAGAEGLALTEDLTWGTPTAADVETEGAAGDRVQVPLVLDASAPVYALDFEVEIDESLASVTAVTPNVPNGWMASHRVQDGVLHIALSGATPLRSATVATVELQRTSPGSAVSLGGQARFGESTPVRVAAVSAEAAPAEFALRGNFPNPTASAAVISLDLPEDAVVRVEVYDTIGRRVMMLEDDLKAGARQSLSVDGSSLPAGVYVYRVYAELEGGVKAAGGRMTIVR